jgi:hypothetical protein
VDERLEFVVPKNRDRSLEEPLEAAEWMQSVPDNVVSGTRQPERNWDEHSGAPGFTDDLSRVRSVNSEDSGGAPTDCLVDLESGQLIRELDPVNTWLRSDVASGALAPADEDSAIVENANPAPHLYLDTVNSATGANGCEPTVPVAVLVDTAPSNASSSNSSSQVLAQGGASPETIERGSVPTPELVGLSALTDGIDHVEMPVSAAGSVAALADCMDFRTQSPNLADRASTPADGSSAVQDKLEEHKGTVTGEFLDHVTGCFTSDGEDSDTEVRDLVGRKRSRSPLKVDETPSPLPRDKRHRTFFALLCSFDRGCSLHHGHVGKLGTETHSSCRLQRWSRVSGFQGSNGFGNSFFSYTQMH